MSLNWIQTNYVAIEEKHVKKNEIFWTLVTGAAVSAGKPRLSSPLPLLSAPPTGYQGIAKINSRGNLSNMPWVCHGIPLRWTCLTKLTNPCSGGILYQYSNPSWGGVNWRSRVPSGCLNLKGWTQQPSREAHSISGLFLPQCTIHSSFPSIDPEISEL